MLVVGAGSPVICTVQCCVLRSSVRIGAYVLMGYRTKQLHNGVNWIIWLQAWRYTALYSMSCSIVFSRKEKTWDEFTLASSGHVPNFGSQVSTSTSTKIYFAHLCVRRGRKIRQCKCDSISWCPICHLQSIARTYTMQSFDQAWETLQCTTGSRCVSATTGSSTIMKPQQQS